MRLYCFKENRLFCEPTSSATRTGGLNFLIADAPLIMCHSLFPASNEPSGHVCMSIWRCLFIREALLYIKNSIIQEQIIKVDGVAEARRFFNIPFAAVEEALSNAVYHKGYDVREPIEVRVEPDRMIIVSHPGADRSISQEGLREYRVFSRRYRNRRIGEFLKEMHLTEGRNTGFRKIRNALHNNGSPEPLFETDDERTYFATTLLFHPDFVRSETR